MPSTGSLRLTTALLLMLIPTTAFAQVRRGVVVDQTGLPLPGVRLDVHRENRVQQTTMTQGDGTFELTGTQPDDIVEAVLEGFETARVPLAQTERITLLLSHTSEVTEVTASVLTSSGAAMERLGSTMTASLAQRLPTSRPRILQSLPLLPGVVRGADGQLRIGGTRPHESSLWLDGFDMTEPVSRTTAIDLPNESVKGMAVLRDPIAATFNGVLGSLASIETLPGGDKFRAGVQGFIPRPRLSRLGLGIIEGFFPRAYAGGPIGPLRYFSSAELNFERVPVPGVTSTSGRPDIAVTTVSSFARFDFDAAGRQHLTFEGMFVPSRTQLSGLSPLLSVEAAPNVGTRDAFIGFVDHIVVGPNDLLTMRFGALQHRTELAASGTGDAILSPTGWSQNSFAAVNHSGTRRSMTFTWDHAGVKARGTHTLSAIGNFQYRTMTADISELPIQILDDARRLARRVEFGLPVQIHAADRTGGVGVRDQWDVNSRLHVDLNLRLDRQAETVASPRAGVSYALDDDGRTILKASVGRFVGSAPLGVNGFGQFPATIQSTFDPATGVQQHRARFQPVLAALDLPRADGIAFDVEHRVSPSLELQASVRQRLGSHLPTVAVPLDGGEMPLVSNGTTTYRELQISVRQRWRPDAEAFVSYVRAASSGDINDFGTMYRSLTTALVQPGSVGPTVGDVPHRLRGWGTVGLPRSVVVSPAVEWRTGFPYSIVDVNRDYVGPSNSARFPNYFSLDITAFKTFDFRRRKLDLGLQLFNVTGHFNPRDVIPVQGSARFREFTNAFGVTLGGYMQVRWQ